MTLIVGFDTETTGVAEEDRIIELALTIKEIESRKSIYTFEHRFSTTVPIHPKAYEIHGISEPDLIGKPAFSSAFEVIEKVAKICPVWLAHNAQFDATMMAREYVLAGRTMPFIHFVDSSEARWATPNGKTPTLGELCFATGVEYDASKAHAALYDITVMLDAWVNGFERGFFSYPILEK